MVIFGDRLKIERKLKQVTLEKMAEDLQTTKATLSRYENNLREPKVDFINQLADYLQCSTDYLLGRTDNRMGLTVYNNEDPSKANFELTDYVYPDDLTHEQVINILKSLKSVGFTWDPSNK